MNKTSLDPEIHEIRLRKKRQEVEKAYNWPIWDENLPFFKLDPNWEIRIRPPTKEAIVKFILRDKRDPFRIVSVVLDGSNQILDLKEPAYWEIAWLDSRQYTGWQNSEKLPFDDDDLLFDKIKRILE